MIGELPEQAQHHRPPSRCPRAWLRWHRPPHCSRSRLRCRSEARRVSSRQRPGLHRTTPHRARAQRFTSGILDHFLRVACGAGDHLVGQGADGSELRRIELQRLRHQLADRDRLTFFDERRAAGVSDKAGDGDRCRAIEAQLQGLRQQCSTGKCRGSAMRGNASTSSPERWRWLSLSC